MVIILSSYGSHEISSHAEDHFPFLFNYSLVFFNDFLY